MDSTIISAIVVSGLLVLVVFSGLRTIADHQRGVVLRLGRRGPLLGPGLHWVVPLGVDRVVRVDMRSEAVRLPRQEVLTADGVPLQVIAAMHLQVVNPVLSVTRVVDRHASAAQLAQAAVRDVASRTTLHALLTELDGVREAVNRFVEERAQPWGIAITAIDLIDIDLPEPLRRAMAQALEEGAAHRPAEASPGAGGRESAMLVAAARMLADQPPAVRERYLEALAQLDGGDATVLLVPLPIELAQPFADLQGRAAQAGSPGPDGPSLSGGVEPPRHAQTDADQLPEQRADGPT